MQLIAFYPTLSLDTIVSSATYFSGQWTPALKRNQSPYLLTHIINKLYGASKGSLFHARIRASHEALAASLNLSRQWTCHLVGVLRDAGWITTEAPRLPNGQQEITIFKLGKQLKRLLVMLLKSKQRSSKSRVNDQRQKIPSQEDRAKNKALFAQLIEDVGKKLGMKT